MAEVDPWLQPLDQTERHRHVDGFGAADRLIADDAHFA
jgi:hypothetical protein